MDQNVMSWVRKNAYKSIRKKAQSNKQLTNRYITNHETVARKKDSQLLY